MTGKVCKCGKGYVSAYDGKCGHCRTKREVLEHKKITDQIFNTKVKPNDK